MLCGIRIHRLKVFARHGVMPQERAVGADFYVSLEAQVEVTSRAYDEDELDGTLNYALLASLIQEEMRTPSRLLEHVAKRIADRAMQDFPTIRQIAVEVEKENPPLGVLCQALSVKIVQKR